MAEIWANLGNGFNEIFSAPFKDASIWWLLTPILLFWIIIEIYFGRHKTEKLGWNTALGNGLSMFWIVVISFKVLFTESLGLFSVDKLIFIIFIAIYSFFIIFSSFTHKIKENVFFLIASPSAVYYLSAIAVLWIHDLFTISIWIITDLIILYLIVLIFESILKRVIPEVSSQEHNELHLGRA